MTASSILSTRAMLVSLSISQWSGRRLDRAVTKEINDTHNAAADAGRYNKQLLPKEALDKITRVVSETRTEFLRRTLPWMDDGARIMSAEGYLAHMSWMRGQIAKFEAEVDDFIKKYPQFVQDAANRLKTMFDPQDYPDENQLRSKFGVQCKVLPVPASSDFRVDMADSQAEEIRREIEAHVTEATNAAVRDVFERVADVTKRMTERLNGYKPAGRMGEKSEGVFRDSLVSNVRDLVEVLPTLNITGDERLAAIAKELEGLTEYEAQTLRDNPKARRDVATEAQRIFDTVSGYL